MQDCLALQAVAGAFTEISAQHRVLLACHGSQCLCFGRKHTRVIGRSQQFPSRHLGAACGLYSVVQFRLAPQRWRTGGRVQLSRNTPLIPASAQRASLAGRRDGRRPLPCLRSPAAHCALQMQRVGRAPPPPRTAALGGSLLRSLRSPAVSLRKSSHPGRRPRPERLSAQASSCWTHESPATCARRLNIGAQIG